MTLIQALRAELFLAMDSAEIRISKSGAFDFLLEIQGSTLDAHGLACVTLMHFCTDGGKFNGINWPISGVLNFLSEQYGKAWSRKTVLHLADILRNHPTEERLRAWALQHFPNSNA